ncbi:hypothetical protein DPEC_G00149440 [Dallia pectoralis]|uniref:Uncharacterized protein n=1 Tax=Dallia pectoralis TaxID=75939 RepID=A0ACC2GIW7_DALPE|nr:hypothetical protein DPEC_G00149440 [Dallia pectoralis]
MPRCLCVSLLVWTVLLGYLSLTGADEPGGETGKAADIVREKRSMPNWALSSSDFFGWVEALREQAGYEKMDELARTFWAHFPSALARSDETIPELRQNRVDLNPSST